MYTIMLFHFHNRCSAYKYTKCNWKKEMIVRSELAGPAPTSYKWVSLALRLHTTQYEQAPIGRSRVGGRQPRFYGVDRGTVRLLRRPTPAPPFAAVKKIPKRCDLLGVTIGGGIRASGSGGSARATASRVSRSNSDSGCGPACGGGGRGVRVRAIRITPEV